MKTLRSSIIGTVILLTSNLGFTNEMSAMETYTEYLWKIQTMSSLEELAPFNTKERFEKFSISLNNAKLYKGQLELAFRSLSVTPNEITFMKEMDAKEKDTRFVIVKANLQSGLSHGVIVMKRVNNSWRLSQEEWRLADKTKPYIKKPVAP